MRTPTGHSHRHATHHSLAYLRLRASLRAAVHAENPSTPHQHAYMMTLCMMSLSQGDIVFLPWLIREGGMGMILEEVAEKVILRVTMVILE